MDVSGRQVGKEEHRAGSKSQISLTENTKRLRIRSSVLHNLLTFATFAAFASRLIYRLRLRFIRPFAQQTTGAGVGSGSFRPHLYIYI
jgi:hypothetical protein